MREAEVKFGITVVRPELACHLVVVPMTRWERARRIMLLMFKIIAIVCALVAAAAIAIAVGGKAILNFAIAFFVSFILTAVVLTR